MAARTAIKLSDSALVKCSNLVETALQAADTRNVVLVQTCFEGINALVDELEDRQLDELDEMGEPFISEGFQKLAADELKEIVDHNHSRLPDLVANCLNPAHQVPTPVFLEAAQLAVNLYSLCGQTESVDFGLKSIPARVISLLNPAAEAKEVKRALRISRHFFVKTDLKTKDPNSYPFFHSDFVDVLLKIGKQQQYEERVLKILGILCSTDEIFGMGETRATAAIQKVLTDVAVVLQDANCPPSILSFGLECFAAVDTSQKTGELQKGLVAWMRDALPFFFNSLNQTDKDVQVSAIRAFTDLLGSDATLAKEAAQAGIFIKLSVALNQDQFDNVVEEALRLVWLCVKHEPEEWVLEEMFKAGIPVTIIPRIQKTNSIAINSIDKICQYASPIQAANLVTSGAAMTWLNYIKEAPRKRHRSLLLRSIMMNLLPTLQNDVPNLTALTQMIVNTVGSEIATRICKQEDESESDGSLECESDSESEDESADEEEEEADEDIQDEDI